MPKRPPKKMLLQIVPDDIDGAVCNNRAQCVLARALYRQTGANSRYVLVEESGLSFTLDGTRYTYKIPRTAKVDLRKFDASGGSVTPLPGTTYGLDLVKSRKVKKLSRAQKDLVNENRRKQAAKRKAAGVKEPNYDRFYIPDFSS